MMSNTDQIKHDLRKLYDQKAETYSIPYQKPAGSYFMWRKINTALFLGSFERDSTLLEIGCANGSYTFEFAKLGFTVTGLDLSPQCIQYARKRARRLRVKNIQFEIGDAEDLSIFPDNTFDGVISFSALRYVPNIQAAVNEIFRILKRHKSVVLDFQNKRSPWFNYLKPRLTGTTHIHDHQYSTREVKHFLHNAGFQQITAKRILYTPKFIGPNLLKIMKYVDIVGESPGFNHFAAIIMCGGIKS